MGRKANSVAVPANSATEYPIEQLAAATNLTGVDPSEYGARYVAACAMLRLDPRTKPFAIVEASDDPAEPKEPQQSWLARDLSGLLTDAEYGHEKVSMHILVRATDYLAVRHRVSREMIDSVRVIAAEPVPVLIAHCRASTPDGRVESCYAQTDEYDVTWLETETKRRATLAVLGLIALDRVCAGTRLRYIDVDIEAAISAAPKGASPSAPEPDISPVAPASVSELKDLVRSARDKLMELAAANGGPTAPIVVENQRPEAQTTSMTNPNLPSPKQYDLGLGVPFRGPQPSDAANEPPPDLDGPDPRESVVEGDMAYQIEVDMAGKNRAAPPVSAPTPVATPSEQDSAALFDALLSGSTPAAPTEAQVDAILDAVRDAPPDGPEHAHVNDAAMERLRADGDEPVVPVIDPADCAACTYGEGLHVPGCPELSNESGDAAEPPDDSDLPPEFDEPAPAPPPPPAEPTMLDLAKDRIARAAKANEAFTLGDLAELYVDVTTPGAPVFLSAADQHTLIAHLHATLRLEFTDEDLANEVLRESLARDYPAFRSLRSRLYRSVNTDDIARAWAEHAAQLKEIPDTHRNAAWKMAYSCAHSFVPKEKDPAKMLKEAIVALKAAVPAKPKEPVPFSAPSAEPNPPQTIGVPAGADEKVMLHYWTTFFRSQNGPDGISKAYAKNINTVPAGFADRYRNAAINAMVIYKNAVDLREKDPAKRLAAMERRLRQAVMDLHAEQAAATTSAGK